VTAAGVDADLFPALLDRVLDGGSLARAEAAEAMGLVMDGALGPARIAALLAALRAKGETFEEIAGFAEAMRARVLPVPLDGADDAIDTCGTGGDRSHTFNISTAAAFVVAGAGGRVAKHGNRAISSRCGSADVLEALGVRIDVAPPVSARAVREAGFGFLFAPRHHAAMKHAAPVRRDLGVRTVMNLLGPVANPAGVKRQLVGVFARRFVEPVARALGALGSQAAAVVHGADGLDEATTTDETAVARLFPTGEVRVETIAPEDFGLARALPEDLRGGDAAANAALIRALLAGEGPRAAREIVLLNAGLALAVAGRAATVAEGIERGRESLASGAARRVLERLVSITNANANANTNTNASG